MTPKFRAYLLVSFGLLVVDQLVKAWARSATGGAENASIYPLWPGVFELKLVFNHGIAFGLFQGVGLFFAPVAIAIALATAFYSLRNSEEPVWAHVGMGLLCAGAIGNLIDRVWLNKVTDMFWFRLIDFPVFNVADACITIGAILVGVRWVFFEPRVNGQSSQTQPLETDQA